MEIAVVPEVVRKLLVILVGADGVGTMSRVEYGIMCAIGLLITVTDEGRKGMYATTYALAEKEIPNPMIILMCSSGFVDPSVVQTSQARARDGSQILLNGLPQATTFVDIIFQKKIIDIHTGESLVECVDLAEMLQVGIDRVLGIIGIVKINAGRIQHLLE